MAKNNRDVLVRAYAILSALRKNIEQLEYNVPEKYVHEFHNVLDKMKGIGIDVSEFRIPDSEIAPRVTSFNRLTGERRCSEEKYVDRPLLLTKLDAILTYFEIITSEKPRRIGYTKSDE